MPGTQYTVTVTRQTLETISELIGEVRILRQQFGSLQTMQPEVEQLGELTSEALGRILLAEGSPPDTGQELSSCQQNP